MVRNINDNVNVSGGFSASNWIFGTARINPERHAPTNTTVTGVNPAGTGESGTAGGVSIICTGRSQYPYSRLREVTVAGTDEPGTVDYNKFDVWIYRTTTYPTDVHYMYWRRP